MECINSRYEPLAHTADKGIRAYGGDLNDLFENAAYGMFSLMADVSRYTPTENHEIEIEAPDAPELLRAWLAELIYQFEVDRILFVDFDIVAVEETRMKGAARGLPFDDRIEWLGSTIKAVTHHDLDIRHTGDRWEATIVFDV